MFGGETAVIVVNEGETQHLLIEIATLRIVNDDVSLTHLRHAMPILRILAKSIPHDGNLLDGDQSGYLLRQKHLGIGVLVDLVPVWNRFDEIALGTLREFTGHQPELVTKWLNEKPHVFPLRTVRLPNPRKLP
jgi:hypothetical protein